jgi:SAM-dependent methyltransferase
MRGKDLVSGLGFCCPVCKGPLAERTTAFDCPSCGSYPLVEGIPDFFLLEGEQEEIDGPNQTWLDPDVVEARDAVYRLCARELKGMAFCMQEICRHTGERCCVLEAGAGTGHFTRWLAEVAAPGTRIYAFDFSWPILHKAKQNTRGLSGVTLFRANARGALPFQEESFDILLLRLAPLGAHGVPNVEAASQLLKPGGWFFEAGWAPHRYETPQTEWAIQHGYESAEHHVWQYGRLQTEEERAARTVERERMSALGCTAAKVPEEALGESGLTMTYENLLVARKPG